MDSWAEAKKRAAEYGIDIKRERKGGWSPMVRLTASDGTKTVRVEGKQQDQADLLNEAIDRLLWPSSLNEGIER